MIVFISLLSCLASLGSKPHICLDHLSCVSTCTALWSVFTAAFLEEHKPIRANWKSSLAGQSQHHLWLTGRETRRSDAGSQTLSLEHVSVLQRDRLGFRMTKITGISLESQRRFLKWTYMETCKAGKCNLRWFPMHHQNVFILVLVEGLVLFTLFDWRPLEPLM